MKTYQPIVIQKANELIDIINETDFFQEENITNMNIVREFFCDRLTEKFLNDFDLNEKPLFHENEMVEYLHQIMILSTLDSLKEKGLIESYEDENTEAVYFLTKEGKELAASLK